MSTNVTWNGVTYSVPSSGEVGWSALSSFLIALGNGAAVAQEMLQAIRVATTTPVTVSNTTDCVVATNLSVAGAVAVTLPAGTDGRWFVIVDQKGDANTNNITITPNGAETINGSATYVISQARDAVILAYSATNTRWNVVGRFTAGATLTNPMATTGDMIYGGASGVGTNLATGSTTGVLHGGNAAVPTWSLLVNADVSASAAIAYSKLAALTSAHILVGSAGNVATDVAVTGDVTISNAGVTAIASGVIVDADINASAAITGTKIVVASGSTAGVVDGNTATWAGIKTFSTSIKLATSGGTAGALDYFQDWATFAPALAKNAGAGSFVSATLAYARAVRLNKTVTIAVKYTDINVNTNTISLKMTLPFAVANSGYLPIFVVSNTTLQVGLFETVGASADVIIYATIAAGLFPVSSSSEFDIRFTYETSA